MAGPGDNWSMSLTDLFRPGADLARRLPASPDDLHGPAQGVVVLPCGMAQALPLLESTGVMANIGWPLTVTRSAIQWLPAQSVYGKDSD